MELKFWRRKVAPAGDGCLLWQGPLDRHGYGRISALAHRIVYEMEVGAIPEGLTLDHLCGDRRCVNPEHLEPVTMQENLRRMTSERTAQVECRRGHPFDEANTGFDRRRGHRRCKTCRNEKQNARRRALRTAQKIGA